MLRWGRVLSKWNMIDKMRCCVRVAELHNYSCAGNICPGLCPRIAEEGTSASRASVSVGFCSQGRQPEGRTGRQGGEMERTCPSHALGEHGLPRSRPRAGATAAPPRGAEGDQESKQETLNVWIT